MDHLNLQSHRVQLVTAALTASAATAALISLYTSFTRKSRRRDLDQDILRSISSSVSGNGNALFDGTTTPAIEKSLGSSAASLPYDEDLIQEQLARNYAFFGDEAMAKIRGGTVVVVGCGGVGSWAAVMLVRS
jgi:hypothetical protein